MPRCQNKAWHAKTRPSKSRTKPETLLKSRVDTNPHRCPAKESPVARIGSTCKRPRKSRGARAREVKKNCESETTPLHPQVVPCRPVPQVSPNLAFTRLTCLGKLFPNTTDNVKIVRKTQHRQPVMQNHAQKPCLSPSSRLSQGRPIGKGPASKSPEPSPLASP